jgi:hypothetical protein
LLHRIAMTHLLVPIGVSLLFTLGSGFLLWKGLFAANAIREQRAERRFTVWMKAFATWRRDRTRAGSPRRRS